MLLRMLKTIVSRRANVNSTTPGTLNKVDRAMTFAERGDLQSAIAELEQHLEQFPHDVFAINNLGCYLSDTGDEAGACQQFELAYSLDDTFLPGIVNHAKFLNERHRSDEALRFLCEAKVSSPEFGHVDSVYGGLSISRGNATAARYHALRAWLKLFDNRRYADSYLLDCSYDGIEETQIAAEHKFWGETLAPVQTDIADESIDLSEYEPPATKPPGTIRIGYWSPDFRNHSVRYFFRPLLDNHDRTRFELFLYYDWPKSDEQTAEIRKSATRFFDVNQCPDKKLACLIKSHELDILVELAGHTSANRLSLMRERLAAVHISGIGYPPTTGLKTIDAKMVDIHLITERDEQYYTEGPLVLPSSFWCFDPYEDAPIAPEPPVARNGYVTFACQGQIAKITQRIIQCWVKILERVPKSRLMIRSIAFTDDASIRVFRQRMLDAGISADRLILLKPEGGANFFASYNDIDIALDTFPFNGGTTTCFATYMGVPVVSLAGQSLISRMGKSILTNLAMSDWVVDSDAGYVDRAVAASSDLESLRRFRLEARNRFRKTALGNGQLFARDFENACTALLDRKASGTWSHLPDVPDLPPEELVRRAYTVLNNGQDAAAQRIVDYCLRAYPGFGAAHILWAQRIAGETRFSKIADYLMQKLNSFDTNSRVAALINIARNFMLALDYQSARQAIDSLGEYDVDDATDAAQIRLLDSALKAVVASESQISDRASASRSFIVSVYIVCAEDEYANIAAKIDATCVRTSDIKVSYTHCPEARKAKTLRLAIDDSESDFVVWINKNVSICNGTFFNDVVAALEHSDVVGFSGAAIYDRLDWKRCESSYKAGAYLSPSGEKAECFEIHVIGQQSSAIASEMKVLDGAMFAFRPAKIRRSEELELDPFLESAATLMEEHFTYQCYKTGLRLAVLQSLGVVIDWRIQLLNEHLGTARWHLTQKLELDPFANLPEDRMILSAPVSSVEFGVKAQRIYFGLAP